MLAKLIVMLEAAAKTVEVFAESVVHPTKLYPVRTSVPTPDTDTDAPFRYSVLSVGAVPPVLLLPK